MKLKYDRLLSSSVLMAAAMLLAAGIVSPRECCALISDMVVSERRKVTNESN